MIIEQIGETLGQKGIPYVRFDGKMSAKRRKEAIARFSVPVKQATAAEAQPSASQSSPRRKTQRIHNDMQDEDIIILDNDDDADFVADENDPEDDFMVDDDDDRPNKNGKGKWKGKGRAAPLRDIEEVLLEGANPKIMLISLKAGALGLNLTVANNVYL
jgi:SWI/SNF-related matrix-associated actin-dependent regulator of chromatin subfamily A3